jgi:predicted dienelactone hydrolase/ABC-type amino acid transport substrate-binding protein
MAQLTQPGSRLHILCVGLISACCTISIGVGLEGGLSRPAYSAERVLVSIGPAELPLSIESLETFAYTGRITGDMRFYARYLDPQALEQFRQVLQRRFEISPIAISQFTYSPIGERVLQQLGAVIRTESDQDGSLALRSAFILAASDARGFNLINFFRRYPSPSIRIRGGQLLVLRQQLTTLLDYRDAAVRAVNREADTERNSQPAPDFSQLPDIRQPGRVRFTRRTLELRRDRQSLNGQPIERQFPVDVYLPEGTSGPAPVVVISHGLGSSRAAFAYLAEHLASYGFAVIVPQHIGSDDQRTQALLSGVLRSQANPVEFIDRPLDIKFTLDTLEQLNQTDPTFANRMNLQQVGMIGHSFGGYTALALAGAELNFNRIRQQCTNQPPTLNISPLLQCLVDRVPALSYPLQDSRIKAVIALSPLTSLVFGPEGMSRIQVPILMASATNDFVTSAVLEQIHPFLWLNNTPEKYLALLIPSGHTAVDASPSNGGTTDQLGQFLSGPAPEEARQYSEALSVAFMQTYLNNRPEYKVFLSSAYARSISQNPLNLEIVRSLTPAQLEQAFGGASPVAIIPPPIVPQLAEQQGTTVRDIVRSGVLRATVPPSAPPFSYMNENGQRTGYCIDLLNTLTTQIQQQSDRPIRLELGLASLEERFSALQTGNAVLNCGPNTIRNDIRGVTFSTPFFVTGTHLLVRTEDRERLNPLSDLANVRLGVVNGSTNQRFVNRQYPQATVVPFSSTGSLSNGVQALAAGRLDALASDGILLVTEARRQNLSLQAYTLVPETPLTCDAYGMAFSNGDQEWQTTLNSFINSPQARQIWNRWFTDQYPYLFLNLDACADR